MVPGTTTTVALTPGLAKSAVSQHLAVLTEAAHLPVYPHGGRYVLGSSDFCHSDLLRIADQVGAVVVSVDYRLAPEHPFPAGLEDSYAAPAWTAGHSAVLDIAPARLAVGGDSAVGGLATAVALLVRDRGGPALRMQYLGIPMLDDRLETASMRASTDPRCEPPHLRDLLEPLIQSTAGG